MNGPKEGEPSYGQWKKEKDAVLASLKERAVLVEQAYGSIEGITCNPVQVGNRERERKTNDYL